MGHSESSSKRELHSKTGLPQETRTSSNHLNSDLKELGKEAQEEWKEKKKIIKVRAEISDRLSRGGKNETKSCFFEKIKLINP